ncbi:hypothetical protein ACH8E3_06645 [Paenibacillus sp. CMAA1364]
MKPFINVTSALLLTLTLVGCSVSEDVVDQATPTQTNTKIQEQQRGEGIIEEIDLYGEIKEVIGNEVEIKVTEIPELLQQGRVMGGGAGATGDKRQKKYTGEEKSIIIPVGIPIVVMSRGENGMVENEISLNELTVGSDLSIFYQDDGETIKKIKVQKPRTGTGGGAGGKSGN